MSEIQRFRARNMPTLKDWGFVVLPVGVAVSGGLFHCSWLAGLAAVGAAGALWNLFRTHTLISPTIDEYREGDYSLAYKLSIYGPVLLFPLAVIGGTLENLLPLADGNLAIELPESMQKLGSGAVYAISTTYSGWGALSLNTRVGQRRLRALGAHPSLDGVTAQRIALVKRHPQILAALAEVGAVDGLRVPHKKLCRLLGVEPESHRAALEELIAEGIINAERIGIYAPLDAWHLTLSELGIRCMHAARHR